MPTGAYPNRLTHILTLSREARPPLARARPQTRALKAIGPTAVGRSQEIPKIHSLPRCRSFSPQPPLARRGRAHTQLTAPPRSYSSSRIAVLLVGLPHLTRFSLCSLSLFSRFSLSFLSSLSLSPVSSGNPRFPPPVTSCLLVDASTRVVYPPSRPTHVNGGLQRMQRL